MDMFTKKQSEIGNTIDKLWINYNKDSKDRKTEDYLRKKLELLNESWADFEANDDKIRTECLDSATEGYFIKEFYQQVETAYLKLKVDIEKRLGELVAQKAAPEPLENNQLIIALKNTMLTMESIMASAEATDDVSKSVLEHIISRLEKYIKFIEVEVEYIVQRGNIDYPYEEVQGLQARAECVLLSLKQKLSDQTTTTSMRIPSISTTSSTVVSPMMQLTKVSVPKFNGDHTKWAQFHDLFTQLVHNQNISKAVKMFYLKDNISGEAERTIRHLNVSKPIMR